MICSFATKYLFGSAPAKHTLTIVRHGQSIWSKDKKWTGWTDIPLSSFGIKEMKECAKTLKNNNPKFDVVYTSLLSRAIKATNYILDELDIHHLPVHKDWRLNEKHYGSLQGHSKVELNQKYGQKVVTEWRRSMDVRPPELQVNDPTHPSKDSRYKDIDPSLLPSSESLNDIIKRLKPLWDREISRDIQNNKNVLVVAHGSSLRALVSMVANNLTDEQIKNFNIPNAVPIVISLDEKLKAFNYEYLGDQSEIHIKMDKIKTETQRKEV